MKGYYICFLKKITETLWGKYNLPISPVRKSELTDVEWQAQAHTAGKVLADQSPSHSNLQSYKEFGK